MAPGRKHLTRYVRLVGLIVGLALLACACGPEPTPLPVILPTLPPPTPTVDISAPDALRYAVAPDALPLLSDTDRASISAHADLIALDAPPNSADLGTAYDLVVTIGDLPDATTAPAELQISLRVDTTLSPLDDPHLDEVLRLAIDPQAIARTLGIPPEMAGASPTLTTTALRDKLANAGYPDGFDVTLASHSLPGAEAIVAMLAAVGIEARPVTGEVAHLTLTSEPPDANAVRLYRLPIHFRAIDGLTITFTPSGFPVAQRSN